MLDIPQLARIKTKDTHVHDALKAIQTYVNRLAVQIGVDANNVIPTPPPPVKVNVTAANGMFNIAVTDSKENIAQNRLLHYFAEYSADTSFANPIVIPMGSSRNAQIQLGNQRLFFRAYSQFFGSNQSDKVYHGGLIPAAVSGGGATPPTQQQSQGSGGGTTGDTGGGFGPVTGGNQGLERL